jgi:hypothetical protein
MMPRRDLTGQRFGALTALYFHSSSPSRWACLCDCGNENVVVTYNLHHGKVRSCGCEMGRNVAEANTRHGHAVRGNHSSIYQRWCAMIHRCTNPSNPQWADYGGRGITVDSRWYRFENFLADMGEPPPDLTLDRKDNDKGYSKGNCRWATYAQQMNNRR